MRVFERPAEFLHSEKKSPVDMTMKSSCCIQPRVLGKPVEYQQIPFEAFEQQAGEEVTIIKSAGLRTSATTRICELKRDFPAPTDFESHLRDHDWTKPT